MKDVLLWILLTILVPLLVNEIGELMPWLARKVIGLSARLIVHPVERAERRLEWLAALPEVPGKVAKLLDALSLLLTVVPRMWIRYGVPGGPRHRRIERALAFGPGLAQQAYWVLRTAEDEGPPYAAIVSASGSQVYIFSYVDPFPHDMRKHVECGDPRLAQAIADLANRMCAAPSAVSAREVFGEQPTRQGVVEVAAREKA